MQSCLCWDCFRRHSWADLKHRRHSKSTAPQPARSEQLPHPIFPDIIIDCQRYQQTASSTSPNFVWDICGSRHIYSLSISQSLLAWQVRIILCPCHLQSMGGRRVEREKKRERAGRQGDRAKLFQTRARLCLHRAVITYLYLGNSVMLFKSIMSTDCWDWYWQEDKYRYNGFQLALLHFQCWKNNQQHRPKSWGDIKWLPFLPDRVRKAFLRFCLFCVCIILRFLWW